MNDDILNQLITMVYEKVGIRKPITRETCLEKDAGITGDDAVEFLLYYSKKYNVDLTGFDIRKYFTPEGDTILPMIIRMFTGKKELKEKELTVGDLEKGVIAK